jgi:hypothetical protein
MLVELGDLASHDVDTPEGDEECQDVQHRVRHQIAILTADDGGTQ